MATLKDLSRHLGLSVTQVSRALNGHSDVSEATRDRVMAAARELNYQPNLSARKLATGRSGTVGLVMTAPTHPSEDPHFVQMISNLSINFSRLDVRFLLHIADGTDDLVEVHRKLVDSASLDGFIVVDAREDDPRICFLRERGVPFVVHGRTGGPANYPYFDIDNYSVARRLTRHLLDFGHRRIAFLNGRTGRSYSMARDRGYRDALAEAGLAYDPDLMRFGPMQPSFGLVETIRLMEDRSHRPTAFIAGNSLIAQGIYEALAALHLSVPEDVSVVGHDDLLPGSETAAMHPPLTVTEAALQESWEPITRLLVAALEGQAVEALQLIGDVRFVERRSAGPVKTA